MPEQGRSHARDVPDVTAGAPRTPARRGPSPLAIAKYIIFTLLGVNFVYYVVQEIEYFQLFGDLSSPESIFESFAGSIAYLPWMVSSSS